MANRFFNTCARCLFFVSIFFAGINAHGQQIKVKCFGINQTIPVFKADTNFSIAMDSNNSLIKRRILKSINQSDAIVEIRKLTFIEMDTYMDIIKFYKDSVSVYRYVASYNVIGSSLAGYKQFKNISPDDAKTKLNTLVKVTDLTPLYKKYDWSTFFKKLTNNHLFDIISGEEFINAVKSVTDEYNYPSGEWISVIQLKAGKQYRNLKYPGSYENPKYKDVDLIKFETNFSVLLNNFFEKRMLDNIN